MLISAMVGLDLRTTLDMDATIKGLKLSEENLVKIIDEIIKLDVHDDVTFKISKVMNIREEEDYDGYRITLQGTFQTIVTNFKIDITTGDIIIPKEISYKFKLLFEEREIGILAYNLETVLSEKIEAIISKAELNTRARDYYDLYILNKFQRQNINENLLKEAVIRKFEDRQTQESLKNINKIIDNIQDSDILKGLWNNYTRKFVYAEDITFEDIINSLKEFIKIIK